MQSRFFVERMLPSNTIISLVADNDGTIEGFVIGIVRDVPPVYELGGPVTILRLLVPRCGRHVVWLSIKK